LTRFLADNFNATINGINGLAASGSPLAEPVIRALQAGRLFISKTEKKVYFRDQASTLFDAATGSPSGASPADLSQVRLNNRIRGIIEGLLGALTLLSPDLDRRYQAAQAVFRSKDPSTLATLDQAIAKETVSRVRKALLEARASIILSLGTAS